MRRIIPSALLVSLLLAGATSLAEEPREVSSEITAVTVFSDRAQVTRESTVRLEESPVTVAFAGLPGWVDDGSVRVALEKPEHGRIVDVRVQRRYLARATDRKFLEAQVALQEVDDLIAALDDERSILDAKAEHVRQIQAFSLEKLPRDAHVREISMAKYDEVVQYVTGALRDITRAQREIEHKRRELVPERAARQRTLQELQSLTQLEETTVLVTVAGSRSRKSTLSLRYMLPGATWQPVHELRASSANPYAAEILSYAVVSQTSGEDWQKAKLTFSTQSSTETNRIPHLTALTLGDSGAAARIVQERAQSYNRALMAFEGQNRLWNKMNLDEAVAPNQMALYDNNLGNLQAVQSKSAAVFQSLRTRGTTAHFVGEGRPTVRKDGHPVRVPIGSNELSATPHIVAVPEQSLNAVRTLQMTNSGRQPLLPGNVALFRDGAFLGSTELDFVAQGEEFALFLGVADQVKLSRMLDRKHSSIQRKKRTRMKVAFVVAVENLSDSPVTLDLYDRIPISENKEIEVEEVEVTGDKKPDKKGLLKWRLTLAPKERKEFRISYQVEYPPALVQEMRRQRAVKQKAMPSTAYDFEEYDVSEQLDSLEKALH